MHTQPASLHLPAGCTVLPAWMAVPLPCDPPRRPCPRPLDPRRLRFPGDLPDLRCPDPCLPGEPARPSLELLPC